MMDLVEKMSGVSVDSGTEIGKYVMIKSRFRDKVTGIMSEKMKGIVLWRKSRKKEKPLHCYRSAYF